MYLTKSNLPTLMFYSTKTACFVLFLNIPLQYRPNVVLWMTCAVVNHLGNLYLLNGIEFHRCQWESRGFGPREALNV